MELSPNTNRPVPYCAVTYPLVFWCETCRMKLQTPAVAIMHLTGRSHKFKLESQRDEKARKQDSNTPAKKKAPAEEEKKKKTPVENKSEKKRQEEDIAKLKITLQNLAKGQGVVPSSKTKEKPNETVQCEDCDLTFDNYVMAVQHLKGRKHKAKIAAVAVAKHNQWLAYRGTKFGGPMWKVSKGGRQYAADNLYIRQLEMLHLSKGGDKNGYEDQNGNGNLQRLMESRGGNTNDRTNHMEEHEGFSNDPYMNNSLLAHSRSTYKKKKNKKNSHGLKQSPAHYGMGRGIPRTVMNGYNDSGYNDSGYRQNVLM